MAVQLPSALSLPLHQPCRFLSWGRALDRARGYLHGPLQFPVPAAPCRGLAALPDPGLTSQPRYPAQLTPGPGGLGGVGREPGASGQRSCVVTQIAPHPRRGPPLRTQAPYPPQCPSTMPKPTSCWSQPLGQNCPLCFLCSCANPTPRMAGTLIVHGYRLSSPPAQPCVRMKEDGQGARGVLEN